MSDYLVCHECGRYFNPSTGDVLGDFIVESKTDRSKDYCRECREAKENELWQVPPNA